MLTVLILLSVTTAGYLDLRWRRIPNWLVVATIAVSLTWHSAVDGLPGLWISLAGLLVAMAVLFPLFLLRAMGAGDVKFLAAIGAAVTYKHVFTVLMLSAIIAGFMALLKVAWERALVATLLNLVDLVKWFGAGRLRAHPVVNIANAQALAVPFGVSAAVATWIFLLLVAR